VLTKKTAVVLLKASSRLAKKKEKDDPDQFYYNVILEGQGFQMELNTTTEIYAAVKDKAGWSGEAVIDFTLGQAIVAPKTFAGPVCVPNLVSLTLTKAPGT
jgi:hypothetical protein